MPPKEKTVMTAYEMFLDKGIVGAVAVLAIAGLIWAVFKLLQSKDDRIKDQGLFADTLKRSNEAVTALTVELNKSNSGLSSAVQSLDKSIKDLDVKVGSLRDEQVRVVAALNTPRGRGR